MKDFKGKVHEAIPDFDDAIVKPVRSFVLKNMKSELYFRMTYITF